MPENGSRLRDRAVAFFLPFIVKLPGDNSEKNIKKRWGAVALPASAAGVVGRADSLSALPKPERKFEATVTPGPKLSPEELERIEAVEDEIRGRGVDHSP